MALPRRVNLGLGPKITVERASGKVLREVCGCGPDDCTPDGAWVDADPDKPKILIRTRIPKAKALEVYFHELQHALADISYWVRDV